MTKERLENVHGAAEIIEQKGFGGLREAAEKVGMDAAMVLLVAFLRRSLDPGGIPSTDIAQRVEERLKKQGLIWTGNNEVRPPLLEQASKNEIANI